MPDLKTFENAIKLLRDAVKQAPEGNCHSTIVHETDDGFIVVGCAWGPVGEQMARQLGYPMRTANEEPKAS